MDSFYKSDKWADIREQVYRRDDFTCFLCGDEESYKNCHHVIPRAIDEDGKFWYDADNLVTICRFPCHRAVHQQGAWSTRSSQMRWPPGFSRFALAYFFTRYYFPEHHGEGECWEPTFPDRLSGSDKKQWEKHKRRMR